MGLARTISHPLRDTLYLLEELYHKLLINLVLYDYSRPRNTRLAGGDKGSESYPVHCGWKIGIIEHNDRGLRNTCEALAFTRILV